MHDTGGRWTAQTDNSTNNKSPPKTDLVALNELLVQHALLVDNGVVLLLLHAELLCKEHGNSTAISGVRTGIAVREAHKDSRKQHTVGVGDDGGELADLLGLRNS
jgi:hypothetical protein